MSQSPRSARLEVLIPFAVVTLIWGSTWIVIRDQLTSVPPSWSVTYRFAIAGVTMLAWAAMRGENLEAAFGKGLGHFLDQHAAQDPAFAAPPVPPESPALERLMLLEEGHCLREQTLAYCGGLKGDASPGLGATSLATVMQMVANGYGITLVPQIAADVEVRDDRVKLLHFAAPEPQRTIGLAWRRTSPRKDDFLALGQLIVEALSIADATSTAS